MWLRKHDIEGASGIGPYEWKPGADVTEVPDELGRELLNLGGFSVAEAPAAVEPAPPAPPAPPKAEPVKVKPAAKHGKPDLGDS